MDGKRSGLIMCCLALVCSAGAVLASSYQSHDSIRKAVSQFVDQEFTSRDVQAVVGKLDNRLRLRQCQEPLDVFWPPGARKQGRGTVGVRCQDAKPWRMFVRVEIKVFKNVAVLRKPRVRGESLSLADIAYERKEVSRLGDRYLTDVTLVSGYTFKRSVKPGTVLNLRMFKAPHVVKRGERVTILADTRGIKVKMSGKALSDGMIGAVIKVRNSSSNRIVEGEVVDKGVVKIRF